MKTLVVLYIYILNIEAKINDGVERVVESILKKVRML
jgi:hypothetical protein